MARAGVAAAPAAARPVQQRRRLSYANPDPDGVTRAELERELAGEGEGRLVVVDVRSKVEVQNTGPLHQDVINIPLEHVMSGVMLMPGDDWNDMCAFPFCPSTTDHTKVDTGTAPDRYLDYPQPQLGDRIVFSCAAGIRSEHAMHASREHGFTDVRNYRGGANEWFR